MTDYSQVIGETVTTPPPPRFPIPDPGLYGNAPAGSPVAPSARTMQKGGRDALVALIGFCVTYTAAHYADMGISPELAGIIPVVANFFYRWLRGAAWGEPIDGV